MIKLRVSKISKLVEPATLTVRAKIKIASLSRHDDFSSLQFNEKGTIERKYYNYPLEIKSLRNNQNVLPDRRYFVYNFQVTVECVRVRQDTSIFCSDSYFEK